LKKKTKSADHAGKEGKELGKRTDDNRTLLHLDDKIGSIREMDFLFSPSGTKKLHFLRMKKIKPYSNVFLYNVNRNVFAIDGS